MQMQCELTPEQWATTPLNKNYCRNFHNTSMNAIKSVVPEGSFLATSFLSGGMITGSNKFQTYPYADVSKLGTLLVNGNKYSHFNNTILNYNEHLFELKTDGTSLIEKSSCLAAECNMRKCQTLTLVIKTIPLNEH